MIPHARTLADGKQLSHCRNVTEQSCMLRHLRSVTSMEIMNPKVTKCQTPCTSTQYEVDKMVVIGGDPELLEERSSKSRSATKFTRNRPQRLLGKVFGFNQYMKGPRQPCAERNLR
jgi:hypothetical protein